MDLQNHQKDQSVSTSAEKIQKVCTKCDQMYMFEDECPACNGKIKERTDALILSARIKNMIDYTSMSDLYEYGIDDLNVLNNIITKNFKKNKEINNG